MLKTTTLVTAGLLVSGCTRPITVPPHIKGAMSAASRPEADRKHDAARKPGQTLAWLGVQPDMNVGELMAGQGYYTELLGLAVGAAGKVYAHNDPYVPDEPTRAAWQARMARLAKGNVVQVAGEADSPELPAGLDLVVLLSAYHDLHWQQADLAALNKRVLQALKPGGTYAVVDYTAKEKSGKGDVLRLHRIEPDFVKKEVLAAGFEWGGSSGHLEVEADGHDESIYAPGFDNGDLADRFVFRFTRPGSEL